MTPIELIALILISLATLKIILMPKIWMNLIKKLYSKPRALFIIELILAGIVLYYLIQNGFTMVQIMAVVAFGALLTGMTMAWYGKETISWAKDILKKGIWKKSWLPILIWVALMIWALLELLKII